MREVRGRPRLTTAPLGVGGVVPLAAGSRGEGSQNEGGQSEERKEMHRFQWRRIQMPKDVLMRLNPGGGPVCPPPGHPGTSLCTLCHPRPSGENQKRISGGQKKNLNVRFGLSFKFRWGRVGRRSREWEVAPCKVPRWARSIFM